MRDLIISVVGIALFIWSAIDPPYQEGGREKGILGVIAFTILLILLILRYRRDRKDKRPGD